MNSQPRQLKALIVDDSLITRKIVNRLLQSLNVRASEVGDGMAAIERLMREPDFDFAIVDWSMPTIDGVSLIQKIRSEPKISGIKLIMLSARDSDIDIDAAISRGADDYIVKPVSKKKMRKKLDAHGLN